MEKYYWSPSTKGFYLESRFVRHTDLPDDLIGLSSAEYEELRVGESQLKTIVLGPHGSIILQDPPAPSDAEVRARANASRLAAYRTESDHLKIEAEYDAGEGAADYTAWRAKVAEIKERYPLPQ